MRRNSSSWSGTLAKLGFRRTGNRIPRRERSYYRRLAVENLEPRQMLAVFTVDSLQDNTTAGDGLTTLREAIASANATTEADQIDFAPSLLEYGPATIGLTLGQLTITHDLAIAGLGADSLTIDQQTSGSARIFTINTGLAATISDLTLTGGHLTSGHGGAIYQYGGGSLLIENAVLSGNTASASGANGGAIYAAGDLTVKSSLIQGNSATSNGGAIYVWPTGTLDLEDSTVDNNAAMFGGGIFVASGAGQTLTIQSSTISNNTASGTGGGVTFFGGASPGIATIVNSTISHNTSVWSGGVRVRYSTAQMTIVNSTVTNNEATSNGGGFGLLDNAQVTLYNTILAGNHAGLAGSEDFRFDGGGNFNPSVSSYNLIGIGTGSGLTNGALGNQVGSTATPLDPGLLPLGEYGGPTKTHSLLVGSPALDAGNDDLAIDIQGAPLEFDQRGHLRPFDLPDVANTGNGSVDIGAFEAGNPTVLAVTTADDELDDITNPNFDFSDLSLREALDIAQWQAGGEEIDLSNIFGTIYLQMGELTVNARDAGSIEIIGPGSGNLTINAHDLTINPQNYSRVFRVNPGTNTTIKGITITGGDTTGDGDGGIGGGIINTGNLTLSSTVVTGNQAGLGGGIYSTGTLSVENSLITTNQADSKGGGIYQIDGTIAISGSQIDRNSTTSTWGGGGGLYVFRVTSLDIDTSTIAENDAGTGAGIYFFAPFGVSVDAAIRNSTIANNTAYHWAGGLYLPLYGVADLDIINTTISNNTAVVQGGGVLFEHGGTGEGLQFTNTTVAENEVANGTGGGIYVYPGANQDKIRL